MKLQYLNSATVLIKTETTKVLCDPWLKDGAYYGSVSLSNIEQDSI